jgi:hypothetical protein
MLLEMPAKANYSTFVSYPYPRAERSYSTKNLLGVNGNTAYNGHLSEATKRRIKGLVSNYTNAVFYSQANGEQLAKSTHTTSVASTSNKTIIGNAISNFHNSKSRDAGLRRAVFLTLTLPSKQAHTDNEIKRNCLNAFLVTLSNYCDIKVWIWVAEVQKNGNIHFHLLIDNYIPFVLVTQEHDIVFAGSRSKCLIESKNYTVQKTHVLSYCEYLWNRCLAKYQYIEEFAKKFGHENPPTTQIEIIKDQRKTGKYMTKYMTKNDKNENSGKRKLEGRIWGCSDSLKNFQSVEIDPFEAKRITYEVASKSKKLETETYVSIWLIDIMELPEVYMILYNHYETILDSIYKPPI